MTLSTKHHTFTACALAATLFLAACGGGASTDTTPPTVAITSAVTAGTGVTFTFTFSEDVGTSFTVDDVAVTGGTKASALIKVSATVYTLVVTPDAAETDVVATLAAGKFSDVANNTNVAGGATTFAATAAPVPPTRAAGDVVSIYSDSYTQVAGFNPRPDWGQPTAAAEVSIGGNKAEKYSGLTYEGIEFNSVDVSAMTKLHIDVWSSDLTAIKVSIISPGPVEQGVTVNPTKYGWNSFDIDLSQYTAPAKAAIFQMKLDAVTPTSGTVYVDNIYFYRSASAPSTTSQVLNFSEPNIGFGVFDNSGGGTVAIAADPTNASNKVVKFVKKLNDTLYFGTKFYDNTTTLTKPVVLATGNQTISLRVYSPAAGIPMLVKLEGGAGGATAEKQMSTTVANAWETLSFVIPSTGTFTTLILMPNFNATVTADTTFYVDDVSYPPGSGTNVTGGFIGGVFADDYVGSLDPAANSAPKSTQGGDFGFYYDARLAVNAGATYDYGGVSGTAQDALGVHNFYYGLGLNAPAITNAYFGAFVKAPGNSTVNVATFTNILVNVWGPDQLFKAGAFPALEVVLNGPAVAGCTSASGGSEVSKTFNTTAQGAAQVYTLPLSSFTLKASCSGETTAAQVLASIAKFNVNLLNTNIQYINKDPNGVAFTNGLNIGSIKFN